MIVGLPLLHILTERELRGVIAHEFGHYAAATPAWGRGSTGRARRSCAPSTSSATRTATSRWSQKPVRLPFLWYGRVPAHHGAISRRQEFAADACAARRVGRDVHVATLRRIHAYAPGFDAYWADEVVAVLRSGRRPPVAEGFQRFITHRAIERRRAGRTSSASSREARPTRTTRTRRWPSGSPRSRTARRRAGRLAVLDRALFDPAGTERALLEFLLGNEVTGPAAVAWDEVGAEVYGARARALTGASARSSTA